MVSGFGGVEYGGGFAGILGCARDRYRVSVGWRVGGGYFALLRTRCEYIMAEWRFISLPWNNPLPLRWVSDL